MERGRQVRIIFLGLAAALAALILIIPSEYNAVFWTALAGTLIVFASAGLATLRRLRQGLDSAGWPERFTLIGVQLILFTFLYMGSKFCPLPAAVIAETAMLLVTAAFIAGEAKIRAFFGWLYWRWKKLLLIALALAVAAVGIRMAIPEIRYRLALSALGRGDAKRAVRIFAALDGYRDSGRREEEALLACAKRLNESGDSGSAYAVLTDLSGMEEARAYVEADDVLSGLRDRYAGWAEGETVSLGEWNGEALTWRVVGVSGGRRLLLCDRHVAVKPYHDEFRIVSWETCSLRAWLNEEFFPAAFSEAERAMIPESRVVNRDNEEYRTDAGDDTTDHIFLLSVDEAQAVYDKRPAWLRNGEAWWLRSPGCSRVDAVIIYPAGGMNLIGGHVDRDGIGVRPALWVRLYGGNE